MADDHATWRKNLPDDFQGKHASRWDGEIDVGIVYKSGVAVVAAFVIALGVCWLLLIALHGVQDEPYVSPIAEANERRLPPTPLLQAHPEAELDEMLATLDTHLSGYGWVDELDGRVHIPIERAMELVLEGDMAARAGVEPAVDEPVDLEGVPALVDEPAVDEPAAEELAQDDGGAATVTDSASSTATDAATTDAATTDAATTDAATTDAADGAGGDGQR